MESSLIGLAIPPLLIVPAMGFLTLIESRGEIGNELKRKAFHVGSGLTALSFPIYLNSPWIIISATVIVLGWMTAVRVSPSLRRIFGGCLHDSGRISYGEIYFAISLASLLMLTADQPLLYVIPVLILTLADAAAAIVGRLFPLGPLRGLAKGKTACGSATFLVVAFLITHVALLCFTDIGHLHSVGFAFTVAVATCVTEMVCRRGFDNAAIPAAAYITLLTLDIPEAPGIEVTAELFRGLTKLISFG